MDYVLLFASRKTLSSPVTLPRRLVGSGWGVDAKALWTAALSMFYSTVKYCAPICCRRVYTRLIDSVLNDAFHIGTGCPTPTDHLPILSGIQPTKLRHLKATLFLAYRDSLNPDHIP